jgi:HNH endonuclease
MEKVVKRRAYNRAYRRRNRLKLLAREREYRIKHKEKRARQYREWASKHKAERRDYARANYAKNRLKRAVRRRATRLADPEKERARNRADYRKHRAKRIATVNRWRARNKVRLRRWHRDYMRRNWKRIYERNKAIYIEGAQRRARNLARALCKCCSNTARVRIYALAQVQRKEVDHRKPLALGGKHCCKNLQLLTPAAHRKKTTIDQRAIRASRRRVEC